MLDRFLTEESSNLQPVEDISNSKKKNKEEEESHNSFLSSNSKQPPRKRVSLKSAYNTWILSLKRNSSTGTRMILQSEIRSSTPSVRSKRSVIKFGTGIQRPILKYTTHINEQAANARVSNNKRSCLMVLTRDSTIFLQTHLLKKQFIYSLVPQELSFVYECGKSHKKVIINALC